MFVLGAHLKPGSVFILIFPLLHFPSLFFMYVYLPTNCKHIPTLVQILLEEDGL